MDSIYFNGSVISYGLAGILSVMLIGTLFAMVNQDDRKFMDPLSWKLKLLWPFIQIIANFFCVFLPYEILENAEKKITQSGVGYLLNAEQFIALRIISAIIAPGLALFVMICLGNFQPIWFVFMPILGFMFPIIWLSDTRKRRDGAVIRSLPVYLDFITMCVEGGLNLQGALGQAMEKAPPGPLRNEFAIVLRDLRSGLSRADSLRRMAERLDIQEITSFVSSIIQAEKLTELGDKHGAWETVEDLFEEFSDDPKLSKVRSDLATEVADFVSALKKGERLEERNQNGSSLAWYLKARSMYPNSIFAKRGINRLIDEILPEDGAAEEGKL